MEGLILIDLNRVPLSTAKPITLRNINAFFTLDLMSGQHTQYVCYLLLALIDRLVSADAVNQLLLVVQLLFAH